MDRKVDDGRIPIELGGRELYLEPSLEACLALDRMGGDVGIGRVVGQIENFRVETIIRVIGLGLVYNGKHLNQAQVEKLLPEDIYTAGIFQMRAKALEFINVVLNGGQPLEDEPDPTIGEGDEEGPLEYPSENSTDDSTSEPLAG